MKYVRTHLFYVCAEVAQLVEQWTENPRVTSSILVLGTIFGIKSELIMISVY